MSVRPCVCVRARVRVRVCERRRVKILSFDAQLQTRFFLPPFYFFVPFFLFIAYFLRTHHLWFLFFLFCFPTSTAFRLQNSFYVILTTIDCFYFFLFIRSLFKDGKWDDADKLWDEIDFISLYTYIFFFRLINDRLVIDGLYLLILDDELLI